jgi:glycosyltransferase involved in cell wall biosynthesis
LLQDLKPGAGDSPVRVTPRVTVVVTLYNAADDVDDLVAMVLAQRHPDCGDRTDWFDAVFVDDYSTDATLEKLREALETNGNPAHVRMVANPENRGLAASLNGVLRTCTTEFVVSCQCDCRFGSPWYVAQMVGLLERHPDAAAITGQPTSNQPIPLKEKINLVENIQDILPRESARGRGGSHELVYTGFAEGRADGFRLSAIRAAGYYDTTLRDSGEDQVLSGRFRELGYNVYQAPNLSYVLSLSSQQDSIRGMLRKQFTWGKTHPYILLRARETFSGVIGKRAGGNRRLRVLLRSSQVVATLGYFAALASTLAGHPLIGLAIVAAIAILKAVVFFRHARRVKMSLWQLTVLAFLQPAFDVSYSFGLVRGLLALVFKHPSQSI